MDSAPPNPRLSAVPGRNPLSADFVLRALPRAVDARPLWAQLNITHRCNLDCAYCTEYDNSRGHVPHDQVARSIDKCRELGVLHVDLIGGEPLLHPDVGAFLRRIVGHGMTTGMTTNGFLLTEPRLDELLAAGLGRLPDLGGSRHAGPGNAEVAEDRQSEDRPLRGAPHLVPREHGDLRRDPRRGRRGGALLLRAQRAGQLLHRSRPRSLAAAAGWAPLPGQDSVAAQREAGRPAGLDAVLLARLLRRYALG